MKKNYTITTLADTERLAAELAKELQGGLPRRSPANCGAKAGETIGLIGNLGAGKTTFVQFLAKFLGVKETVNSPTFNIIKTYKIINLKSKIKNFIHIDAYRLNSPEELQALGVAEYFSDPQTVTVIEWADKVQSVLPQNATVLTITIANNGLRTVSITGLDIK